MVRWNEINGLRGLMLMLMTLTHLPTRFGNYTGQPYGFISAAEGFVFLSAYMVVVAGVTRVLSKPVQRVELAHALAELLS